MNDAVVIDTNLVFSALVSRRARLRELLLTEPGLRLLCPRFLFVELFNLISAVEIERKGAKTQRRKGNWLGLLPCHTHRARERGRAWRPVAIPSSLRPCAFAPLR